MGTSGRERSSLCLGEVEKTRHYSSGAQFLSFSWENLNGNQSLSVHWGPEASNNCLPCHSWADIQEKVFLGGRAGTRESWINSQTMFWGPVWKAGLPRDEVLKSVLTLWFCFLINSVHFPQSCKPSDQLIMYSVSLRGQARVLGRCSTMASGNFLRETHWRGKTLIFIFLSNYLELLKPWLGLIRAALGTLPCGFQGSWELRTSSSIASVVSEVWAVRMVC